MTTTVALFNNKGGVGKTTLVYHLAYMMNRLGLTVLTADLDPQSNLTAMCLDEQELEELWNMSSDLFDTGFVQRSLITRVLPGQTVADAVFPILEGTGDIAHVNPTNLDSGLWLLPGSISLSAFEDKLSSEWPKSFSGDPAAVRTTTAFHRIIDAAARECEADITLIDVGPNLGAINRAALLSADHVVMPLAADLFSLKGLSNLGPTLNKWRGDWQQVVTPRIPEGITSPVGKMQPTGYVVMQPEMRLDRPVQAYARWLERIPKVFASAVLGEEPPVDGSHPCEIQMLRNYRSLMPLSHDARRPMFDLRVADGAFGSTQELVWRCYSDFKSLALAVCARVGVEVPEP
jgi:cellulose biosynthesis protein BcsQ